MSLANKLRSNKDNPAETFFATVKSFHIGGEKLPFVTVAVHGTNEERRVSINPDSKITNIKEGFDRPGLERLTSGKMKTAIGGTIRVENAFHDRATGNWLARWVSTALPTPDHGYAVEFKEARVSALIQREGGKPYRVLDVLDSSSAERVTTLAGFESAVAKAVEAYGNAFVRFHGQDEDGKDVFKTALMSGGKQDAPLEERVARALASPNDFVELVRTSLAEGDLGSGDALEVVPAKRIFFGGDTAINERFDKMFCNTSEDGTKSFAKGFTHVLATVHYREDDPSAEMLVGVVPKVFGGEFSRTGSEFKVGANPGHGSEAEADEMPDAMDLGDLMQSAPPPAPAAPRRPAVPGM